MAPSNELRAMRARGLSSLDAGSDRPEEADWLAPLDLVRTEMGGGVEAVAGPERSSARCRTAILGEGN